MREFKEYTSDAAVAADLANRVELLTIAPGREIAAVPNGYSLQSVEQFMPAPYDRAGLVTLFDPASFAAYVSRFASESSVIFADGQRTTVTAILDYHEALDDKARHGRWRAVFTLRPTEDWRRWTGKNGQRMTQVDFAQFLEDNLATIAEPPGADLLTIATVLEVKRDVTFRSAIRLHDGMTQFRFEENDAAQGAVSLPPMIKLGIVPFEGTPHYGVDARVRYRLHDGKLSLWYDLVRPDKIVEDAFAGVENDIRTALTIGGMPWYHGHAA
jgi:uncharacterized protein YfdQ (DUF2303 family)